MEASVWNDAVEAGVAVAAAGSAQIFSANPPIQPQAAARLLNTLRPILSALRVTRENVTTQCAVASLGHYIPGMADLPGFEQIHAENYEVAYHLTTAIGAAERLLAGSREPGYIALLASCMTEVWEHQRKVMEGYSRLSRSAPAQLAPLIRRIGGLVQATTGTTERAMGLAVAAVGRETLQRLAEWELEVRPQSGTMLADGGGSTGTEQA